jgi:hypothetical protein
MPTTKDDKQPATETTAQPANPPAKKEKVPLPTAGENPPYPGPEEGGTGTASTDE